MQCPKCHKKMDAVTCESVVVDRCKSCSGLWFDVGEAEQLATQWVAEFVDTGKPEIGEAMDRIDSLACPRCGLGMRRFFDVTASQLQFEECDEHGKFFDAGEFTVWVEQRYLP